MFGLVSSLLAGNGYPHSHAPTALNIGDLSTALLCLRIRGLKLGQIFTLLLYAGGNVSYLVTRDDRGPNSVPSLSGHIYPSRECIDYSPYLPFTAAVSEP